MRKIGEHRRVMVSISSPSFPLVSWVLGSVQLTSTSVSVEDNISVNVRRNSSKNAKQGIGNGEKVLNQSSQEVETKPDLGGMQNTEDISRVYGKFWCAVVWSTDTTYTRYGCRLKNDSERQRRSGLTLLNLPAAAGTPDPRFLTRLCDQQRTTTSAKNKGQKEGLDTDVLVTTTSTT